MDNLRKRKSEYKNLKKQEIHDIFIKQTTESLFSTEHGYEDFKDLTRRTASNKMWRDKSFDIAKNPKSEIRLSSMVYKFFDKKTSVSGIKIEKISNKELAEELHKPIIRKF